MKTPLISDKEVQTLFKFHSLMDEISKDHQTGPDREKLESLSDIEKIHTLMYLDLLGEFSKNLQVLMELLTISEEAFEVLITENGEHSIEEILAKTLFKVMLNE